MLSLSWIFCLRCIPLLLYVFFICDPQTVYAYQRRDAVRRSVLQKLLREEYNFIPVLDGKIHCVGRWLPTSNLLRWDTAFPGSYIDLVFSNASIIYISLNNLPSRSNLQEASKEDLYRRMDFSSSGDRDQSAAPVALICLLCDGSLIHFEHSGFGLIRIDIPKKSQESTCAVRVSYVGAASGGNGVLQFKGVWLPQGASLLPRPISGIHQKLPSNKSMIFDKPMHRKTVELVTDDASGSLRDVLSYSVHWLAQAAASFGVDHVQISAQGHCLTEACTASQGIRISTQNIFFRLGPFGTALFPRPWNFGRYTPDALIFDLGTVDHQFIHQDPSGQNGSGGEEQGRRPTLYRFTSLFVNSYMEFIRQIRRSAYPLHPSTLDRYLFDGDGYTYNSAPSTLPIFVMRPVNGALERATLEVVERIQKEGDKSVFWIDTSGWLSDRDYSTNGTDRYLTPAGHEKMGAFMHAHLCHYLASNPKQCPFLRRDNYMGSVYVPAEAELDKAIEDSKIKKLTQLFWGNDLDK